MNKAPRVAVSAAIFFGNKILLVKRGTKPSKGMWAFPGGKVKYWENLVEALKREIKEEVGLDITPICLYRIAEIFCEETKQHFLIAVFLARADRGELILNPEEVEDAVWASLSKALKYNLTKSTRIMIESLLSLKNLPELLLKPKVYSLGQKPVSILNFC